KNPPRLRHTLQGMCPTVGKREPRARDDVANRLRDQDFAPLSECCNSRGDMNRKSAESPPCLLDLSGVDARAQAEAEGLGVSLDCLGATNRTDRAFEHGQQLIAHEFWIATLKRLNVLARQPTGSIEEIAPGRISQPDEVLGRSLHVGDQDRRKDT